MKPATIIFAVALAAAGAALSVTGPFASAQSGTGGPSASGSSMNGTTGSTAGSGTTGSGATGNATGGVSNGAGSISAGRNSAQNPSGNSLITPPPGSANPR